MNTKVAKKNNKGFTLIELIVVIAIIAVLAAILAPQYLRYVEKSRESADVQAAVEIINASKTAAAEEKVYNQIAEQSEGANPAGITVVWNKKTANAAANLTVADADVSTLADNTDNYLGLELKKTIDLTDYKSKKYRSDVLKFKLTVSDEKVEVKITSDDAAKWTDNESLSKYQ